MDTGVRALQKEVVVGGKISEVWDCWTTNEGVRTFFAPDSNVVLRVGGPYEILFVPDAPEGQKGGEGLHILSYMPHEMLSFEWKNPPSLQEIRGEKTWVVIQLESIDKSSTGVKLTHLGWRTGDLWDKAYQYFDRAWDIVLGRLEQRFREGPVDWSSV